MHLKDAQVPLLSLPEISVCTGEARAARLCGMLLTIVATTKRLQVAQGIAAEPALKERVRDAEQRMQQAITRSA